MEKPLTSSKESWLQAPESSLGQTFEFYLPWSLIFQKLILSTCTEPKHAHPKPMANVPMKEQLNTTFKP